MPRAISILALLVGATTAFAAGAEPSGYFSNPARDIDFSNVQNLNRSPRIVVPTVYVRFSRWGRIPLRTAESNAEGAIIDLDVPVSVDTVRELATQLRDDLATRLKTAGWEVMGTDQIKDNAAWSKLPRVEPDRRFGVPFEQANSGNNPRRYLIVTPPNAPVIVASATGPAWAMKDLVTEFNAIVLVPTYTFDVVPVVPAATTAGTPVEPHLQLVDVNFDFRTPGGAGGSIRSRTAEVSTDLTGQFTVPNVKEEKRQKALEDAAMGKGRGELALEPDAKTLVSTGVAVGTAFNTKVVEIVSAYAPR